MTEKIFIKDSTLRASLRFQEFNFAEVKKICTNCIYNCKDTEVKEKMRRERNIIKKGYDYYCPYFKS